MEEWGQPADGRDQKQVFGFIADRRVTRVLDVTLTLLLLAIVALLMGLIALAVKLDSGGTILSRHERTGPQGKFVLIKFRTVELRSESVGEYPLHNHEYVTRVGEFLRTTRLEDLPLLYNVLQAG